MLEMAAYPLVPEERDAVLGDMIEAGETGAKALQAVLGLVLRREMLLWQSWRPWVAGLGIALPFSFPLIGSSLGVSWSYLHVVRTNSMGDFATTLLSLLCQGLLLVGWSWSAGFVTGLISRRTLWVSSLLCFAPCLFCETRFHNPSLSRLSLLLFLVPVLAGVWMGWRKMRVAPGAATVLAITLAALMLARWNHDGVSILSCFLLWPALYLMSDSMRSRMRTTKA
jgi:hypothetical protein